jgi:hypothetical protein
VPEPGYGAAVHAGILAPTPADGVCLRDGPPYGSVSNPPNCPRWPIPCAAARRCCRSAAGARPAVPAGRRTPGWRTPSWPGGCAAPTGLPVHDIGPMRAAFRDDLLALKPARQRFGYPLELLVAVGGPVWPVTRGRTSRTTRGGRRHPRRRSPGPCAARPGRSATWAGCCTGERPLVLAKTPGAGRVKTRPAPPCTPDQAARVAAAALGRHLRRGERRRPRRGARSSWRRTHPARPAGSASPNAATASGARLAHAVRRHPAVPARRACSSAWTPRQLTADRLASRRRCSRDGRSGAGARRGRRLVGARPRRARRTRRSARHPGTSLPTTGARNAHRGAAARLRVATLPVLRDVDTAADRARRRGVVRPASRSPRPVGARSPGGDAGPPRRP